MRRTRLAVGLSLALAVSALTFPAHLHSQSAPPESTPVGWRLLSLGGGIDEAEAAINSQLTTGLVPIGVELEPDGTLLLLFTREVSIEFSGWRITEHMDWNSLETDVTAGIRDGFRPVDISRTPEGLLILWLRSDDEISGWRIHAASPERTARAETVQAFRENGFALQGLSAHEGLDWYLFVRQGSRAPAAHIRVHSGDPVTLRDGISATVQDGTLPCAIAHDDEGFLVAYQE